MTNNKEKGGLPHILDSDIFYEALLVSSSEEYSGKTKAFKEVFRPHYSNPWNDSPPDGVRLFETALKSMGWGENFGTWMTISRQFSEDKPSYQLTAYEYSPWGSDIESEHIADYDDLGKAFDEMWSIHNHGRIELNVIQENEDLGRYSKGESSIDIPDSNTLSETAILINNAVKALPERRLKIERDELKRKKINEEIHRLAWESSIPLESVKPIVDKISEKLKEETLSDEAIASAINQHLFKGQGKILLYQCSGQETLANCRDYDGEFFVVIKGESGGHVYINTQCGIHDCAEDARAAVREFLNKGFSPLKEGDNLYWIEEMGDHVELNLDELTVDEVEPFEFKVSTFDKEEDYDSDEIAGSKEYRVVEQACYAYRFALESRIRNRMEKRHDIEEISLI